MSRSYECGQFERNYKAVRLCNWEVPAERARPLKPTSSKPPAKTEFIASDNGHLLGRSSMLKAPPPWQRPSAAPATPQPLVILGGLAIPWGGRRSRPTACSSQPPPKAAGPTAFDHAGRKVSASFVTGYDAMQTNRWPDDNRSTSTYGGGATMGYR